MLLVEARSGDRPNYCLDVKMRIMFNVEYEVKKTRSAIPLAWSAGSSDSETRKPLLVTVESSAVAVSVRKDAISRQLLPHVAG